MLLEKYGHTYCLKDCKTVFENFSGRPSRYNPNGARNFNVKINDPAIVQELINDGFNVTPLKKLSEDSPDEWKLKMTLNYRQTENNEVDPRDPQIKEVFEGRTAELTRHNVHSLDQMRIKKANIEFNPYYYEKGENKCTAYVNRAKFWVVDDWFTNDEEEPVAEMQPALEVDEDDIPF